MNQLLKKIIVLINPIKETHTFENSHWPAVVLCCPLVHPMITFGMVSCNFLIKLDSFSKGQGPKI